MRGWLLAIALLLSLPGVAAQGGSGSGPLALTLHITDHGSPLQGSISTVEKSGDTWRSLEATLDGTGTGTLHLQPGQPEIFLRGPNPEQRNIAFGQVVVDHALTLSLDLAPHASTVSIDLTVVDGETGALLPSAEVLPQMLFGDYQCIGTRPSTGQPPVSGQPYTPPPSQPCDLQWERPGHLVGNVPPGVLDLRASTENHSTCMVGFQDAERTPCRLYAPTLRTFAAIEGQTVKQTIALPVIPPPDAGLEGYLISNITGHAIPSKSIQFLGTGIYSNVGFSAYLDHDGSYRLRIPAGNYTATSFVCGHDQATVAFTATSGHTLRLDLVLEAYGHAAKPLPPGAGTSYTASASSSGSASASYAGASGSPPGYPACDSQTMTIGPGPASEETAATTQAQPSAEQKPVEPQIVGGIAVADFGGGLGPLGGVQYVDSTGTGADSSSLAAKPSRFSPSLPGVAVVGLVALALALRRRLP